MKYQNAARRTVIAALVFGAPGVAAAVVPAFQGTAIETRDGSNLAAALGVEAGGRDGWVAWTVPAVEGHGEACCFEGPWHEGSARRRGCRLDGKTYNMSIDGNRSLATSDRFTVLARFEGGQPRRIRVYSADCPIDAGSARVVWLDDVDSAQSVAWLDGLARDTRSEQPGGEALAAMAFHADPSADAAIIALASPATPLHRRADAIFWLGQTRGERGFRELQRQAVAESDAEVLGKVAFSLSQCPVAAAGPVLERMAMSHPDSDVRAEAIFWMGQRGGDGIADKLVRVVREDADREVRKKAIFALSQLDGGAGVDSLVDLVRHGRDIELRREALFWLGQSEDPRAQESLEALLLRR